MSAQDRGGEEERTPPRRIEQHGRQWPAGVGAALGLTLLVGIVVRASAKPPAVSSRVSAQPSTSNIARAKRSAPSPQASHSPAVDAELRRGIAALEQRKLAAAVASFQRAVRQAPDSYLTHDYLGIAYLQSRQFVPALKEFQTEVRLAADPAIAWARIADVYQAQGRFRDALRAVERARTLRPDLAQLHFNAGMLYIRTAELGKAVTAVQKAVTLEPENHSARYVLGNLLVKLARLDEAEQEISAAIQMARSVGIYHYGLAQILIRRGTPAMTERARAELVQALTLGVAEPAAAHYYLGLCLQRTGAWEDARRELETSVKIAPEAWAAWYSLQEVRSHLGDGKGAAQARERFRVLRRREDARMQRKFYAEEAQRNPESAEAQFQLAEFLANQGEAAPARQALERAQRLAARKSTPELRRRLEALSTTLKKGMPGKAGERKPARSGGGAA